MIIRIYFNTFQIKYYDAYHQNSFVRTKKKKKNDYITSLSNSPDFPHTIFFKSYTD